LQIAISATPGT